MVLNSAFCWWWNCRLLDDPQDILSRICSIESWPTSSASRWFENQPMVCLNQPTNVSFKELWWYDDSSIHGIIYQKSLWKSCEKLSRKSPKQQNNNTRKEIFQSSEIKSGWPQQRRGQHIDAVIDWEVRRTLVQKQHSELQTLLGNALEVGQFRF